MHECSLLLPLTNSFIPCAFCQNSSRKPPKQRLGRLLDTCSDNLELSARKELSSLYFFRSELVYRSLPKNRCCQTVSWCCTQAMTCSDQTCIFDARKIFDFCTATHQTQPPSPRKARQNILSILGRVVSFAKPFVLRAPGHHE